MPISVMLKPSSSICNLKCAYCFYNSLSSQRTEPSKGMMTTNTAKNAIISALDFANGTQVFFTFQGGEPLLASIEFYKEFFDTVKKENKKGSQITYCIQTNGTLIDEEWCRLFKENNCLVGVSLDGDETLNKYRTYENGKSSFDDVVNGIELLKKYDVTFNVLSVLTADVAKNVRQSYRFFKSLDLKYIQYIPCLKPFDGEYDKSIYMTDSDYAEFLNKGFKLYFNDNMRGNQMSVRMFDNYVLLANSKNAEQCGMNGMCSTQFVVEGDGSTYPCDFYCTDDWLLGNINELSFKEMYSCKKSVDFLKESFAVNEKCKKCDYFYICRGGGCKRLKQSSDYCKAYKNFFGESLHLIKQMR